MNIFHEKIQFSYKLYFFTVDIFCYEINISQNIKYREVSKSNYDQV